MQQKFVPEHGALEFSIKESKPAIGREFPINAASGKPKLGSDQTARGSTFSGAHETASGIRLVPGVKNISWSKLPENGPRGVKFSASGGSARHGFYRMGSPPPAGAQQVPMDGPPQVKTGYISLQSPPPKPPAAQAAEQAFAALSGDIKDLPVASTASEVLVAPASAEVRDVLDAQFIEKLKALLSSKERSSTLELENKIMRKQLVAMGGEIALLKAELSIKKG